MSLTFASGTAGTVRTGVGNTVVAGLNKWSITKTLKMIPTNTFDLTADGNGVVWEKQSLKGLASATAEVEGFFDIGNNTETTLYIGAVVALDLLFDKTAPFGYTDLAGTVTEITAGTVFENQAASFRAKFTLTGTVAAAA